MKNLTPGLGLLLHDASRAVRRRFEERSAEFGLSSAQWRMMLHVCRLGGAAQSRFADLLEIEPISVSRLVDRMEEQGWVTRADDPADRRVRLVKPTAKALDAFAHIKSIADLVYDDALAGLDAAQRRDLMAVLTIITENLARADMGPERASA